MIKMLISMYQKRESKGGYNMKKNVKNGSSVTPEINVSKVTLNAPSCKLKTLPNILAINIFFFDGFLLNIGLYMQKYPKKQA